LQSGALTVGGAPVGEVVTARVGLVGGSGARAELSFAGRALELRAEVDLARAHLQAGVRRDAALGGTAFATRLRAGAWAPVLGITDDGVRIALPPGAPATDATLARAGPGARRDPEGMPWSSPPERAPAALRARPTLVQDALVGVDALRENGDSVNSPRAKPAIHADCAPVGRWRTASSR